MKQLFGILLLEKTEVTLRVYEANEREWKLLNYQNKPVLNGKNDTTDIIAALYTEIIAELLLSHYTQNISEWKVCSRNISQPVIRIISSATGFAIEDLTLLREQELLCKGMFTELW